MPLINWIEDLQNSEKFEITDAKLHVFLQLLYLLKTVNVTKQLSEGFKTSAYWNNYQTKPAILIEKGTKIYKLLNESFQGVRRLFVLACAVAAVAANHEASIKGNKKYFLTREEIKTYNVLTDRRNFYDQAINDLIKQYDTVRDVLTGHGDDYTTGSLLDYAYFKDNYKLIAVDLSKQKGLDADLRATQPIVLQGVVGGDDNRKIRLCATLKQSKETGLEFYEGIEKLL